MMRLNSQLSCQCSGFPPDLQRPLLSEVREIGADDAVYGVEDDEQFVSIVQLNTANGAEGSRREDFIKWLQMQSQRGVNIVTLCEANKWESFESKYTLDKNRKVIEQIASEGGFTYSFVADFLREPLINNISYSRQTGNGPHPYNIGIISSLPFTILNLGNCIVMLPHS